MPMTPKVTRRIVSNAGPWNAAVKNSTAIISSPSANESIIRYTERRRGRPPPRLRAASTTVPARQTRLNATS
jgi:hypothetical protein